MKMEQFLGEDFESFWDLKQKLWLQMGNITARPKNRKLSCITQTEQEKRFSNKKKENVAKYI